MSEIPILVLRLEAPIQSWGLRARWNFRDSAEEPSKSGIIGIIGCALGYRRDDQRLEDLDRKLKVAVRVEKEGVRSEDFHTITGAHFKAGGGQFTKKTEVSRRIYIYDASFVAFISGPENLLNECKNALEKPKWPIYLGRKCCPPTTPVFEEFTTEYASLEDAVKNYPWKPPFEKEIESLSEKEIPEELRFTIDDINGNIERRDAMRINPARLYEKRKLRKEFIKNPSYNDLIDKIKKLKSEDKEEEMVTDNKGNLPGSEIKNDKRNNHD
ncbi:MAG: type I-E CRISPR-associated protein Cas5/CasD [Promethearchaeota archaeon]